MFYFLLFGRGRGPRPNSQKTRPRPNSKKENTPPPLPSVLFLLFWRVVVFFFAVWPGGVFILLLFGWGSCFVFCCLGRGSYFVLLLGQGRDFLFAVWTGGVLNCFAIWAVAWFLFLLFGRGTGAHSLTGLPGSSLSDPSTKKTKQRKKEEKKTRVPLLLLVHLRLAPLHSCQPSYDVLSELLVSPLKTL